MTEAAIFQRAQEYVDKQLKIGHSTKVSKAEYKRIVRRVALATARWQSAFARPPQRRAHRVSKYK